MSVCSSVGVSTLVCVVLAATTLGARQEPGHPLTVRVYNTYGVSRADLHSALAVADTLFDEAGVSGVQWRECRMAAGPSHSAPDPCDDPRQPGELVVRLHGGSQTTADAATVFGYSLVDPRARGGTFASIFTDGVAVTAQRLNIRVSTLLGRALAHEVGHLLLGTNAHSATGLMRAHWSDAFLRAGRPRDWRFSPQDRRELTAKVRQRTTPAAATLALARTAGSSARAASAD